MCRSGSCCVLVAVAALVPSPVRAQAGSAAITGIIRDSSAAPIPGVAVTLDELSTGQTREAISSSDGVYAFVGMRPDVYRLRIALAGFRPLSRNSIELRTGETVRLDLELSIGSIAEAVAVTADAPAVQASSGSLGQVVDERAVVGLPLNGRSFVALTALAPGVALPPGSLLPRINGGRPRTNEYLFDGISVLQPEPGQVAFFPVVDAIREMKIETNSPPAEFGRFNGGVVNLTTKAGTNAFHGDGFGFFRHEALNARNLFAPADAAKPMFRRRQFGAVLGGPVRRNATFFFADYQGQRQAIGRTAISTVPTRFERQGIFNEPIAGRVPVIYDPATTVAAAGGFARTPFPGNAIPIDRMDPVALALLQRYPLPTSPGTANNYRRVGTEVDDQDQLDLRIDHRFAANRDQLFGRVSHFSQQFDPVTPLPDGSGIASGTLGRQQTAAWAVASNHQHIFSDRLLNEVRVGDTRRSVSRSATELSGSVSSVLGLRGIPANARFPTTLPTFAVNGYQQLGSPPNTATRFGTSVTELVDALTWVRGRHTIKSGLDFRWERLNVTQPPSPTGSFQFSTLFTDLPGAAGTGNALASFLLGQVQTFSIDLQQEEIRNRARVQEYFVQDDWKRSDRITINLGVRYTLNFPSYEEHNQAAVFNLQTGHLEYLGRDGYPRSARELHKLDFGPRLGLVDRVSADTVIRAGYALVWIEQAGITTPFTTPVFPFLQTATERTLDNITPAFVLANGPSVVPVAPTPDAGLGQGVFAVDRTLGSGYVQQWNVSTQHALSARTSLEIGYIGSRITHVGIPDTNLNQLTAAQLALGPALLQRVANPYFGQIPRSSSLGDPQIPAAQLLKPYPQYTTVSLYRNNVGTTDYRGIEAKFEQRLSHGLSSIVSYTRSKLVDDASSVFDASVLTGPVTNYPVADSFNRRLERDVSTGDIPNVLSASLVWDVKGWTFSAIATWQSGMPLPVTQATNFNAFAGFGIQRPNRNGDPTLPPGERSLGRWFDTSVFTVAPAFTIGNSSRNPVRGPAYRNVDVAVMRRMAIGSGRTLEARAEAFNVTNTPPLGPPNTVLGSAGFGTITSAGDPRVVQLAVKFIF